MKEIIEIRWHGRGGQGAKTAALLFADALMGLGKYVQAFPEYGPERMGAPVQAFNRVSDKPIRIHCNVEEPDIVIVLDASLIDIVDVSAGLRENGILLINSKEDPEELRRRINLKKTAKLFTVDASGIAQQTIGKDVPNTAMLGALIKITKWLDLEKLIEEVADKLSKKFSTKQELIESNLEAIRKAYNQVKE